MAINLESPEKAEEIKKQAQKNKKDTLPVQPLPPSKAVNIDFDGIEQRMVLLPPEAGNYGNMSAMKGKLVYMRYPNTGTGATPGQNAQGTIKYFDLEKKEEKRSLKRLTTSSFLRISKRYW